MTTDFLDKPLPSAIDMERAILGAVLLDNGLMDDLTELVPVEAFFLDSHRRLLKAMTALWGERQPIELITLTDYLKKSGDFERVGGATYIASLIDGVPRTDNVEPYARKLRARYQTRRLIKAAQLMVAESLDDPDDEELLSRAESYLAQIVNDSTDRAELKTLYDSALEYKKLADVAKGRGDYLTGIPTGFIGFDGRTLGMQNQELIVIAARPSMGKTTWSWNIAHNVTARAAGYRTLFWSGEMPHYRMGGKAIAKQERVDAFRMRTGDYDSERVEAALDTFYEWNDRMLICDKPHISVAELRAICRRLKAKQGLDILFADYLLLFANPPGVTDRREAVSENCLMLKGLARELNIPIVVLHQMSRAVDSRSSAEEEPRLTDLSESGDVERHADVVTFLWRKRKQAKHEENVTRCFVAKQRNGPVGRFGLVYIKAEDRFENMARDEERLLFQGEA